MRRILRQITRLLAQGAPMPQERALLIVDGMNVIGSRPDGWWRDRPGAQRRLTRRLQTLAGRWPEDLAVVFDGRPLDDLPEGPQDGVQVWYALRGGSNAADDRIVALVRDLAPARPVSVVTSDRELARRVRSLGARVEGASAFLQSLEQADA